MIFGNELALQPANAGEKMAQQARKLLKSEFFYFINDRMLGRTSELWKVPHFAC